MSNNYGAVQPVPLDPYVGNIYQSIQDAFGEPNRGFPRELRHFDGSTEQRKIYDTIWPAFEGESATIRKKFVADLIAPGPFVDDITTLFPAKSHQEILRLRSDIRLKDNEFSWTDITMWPFVPTAHVPGHPGKILGRPEKSEQTRSVKRTMVGFFIDWDFLNYQEKVDLFFVYMQVLNDTIRKFWVVDIYDNLVKYSTANYYETLLPNNKMVPTDFQRFIDKVCGKFVSLNKGGTNMQGLEVEMYQILADQGRKPDFVLMTVQALMHQAHVKVDRSIEALGGRDAKEAAALIDPQRVFRGEKPRTTMRGLPVFTSHEFDFENGERLDPLQRTTTISQFIVSKGAKNKDFTKYNSRHRTVALPCHTEVEAREIDLTTMIESCGIFTLDSHIAPLGSGTSGGDPKRVVTIMGAEILYKIIHHAETNRRGDDQNSQHNNRFLTILTDYLKLLGKTSDSFSEKEEFSFDDISNQLKAGDFLYDETKKIYNAYALFKSAKLEVDVIEPLSRALLGSRLAQREWKSLPRWPKGPSSSGPGAGLKIGGYQTITGDILFSVVASDKEQESVNKLHSLLQAQSYSNKTTVSFGALLHALNDKDKILSVEKDDEDPGNDIKTIPTISSYGFYLLLSRVLDVLTNTDIEDKDQLYEAIVANTEELLNTLRRNATSARVRALFNTYVQAFCAKLLTTLKERTKNDLFDFVSDDMVNWVDELWRTIDDENKIDFDTLNDFDFQQYLTSQENLSSLAKLSTSLKIDIADPDLAQRLDNFLFAATFAQGQSEFSPYDKALAVAVVYAINELGTEDLKVKDLATLIKAECETTINAVQQFKQIIDQVKAQAVSLFGEETVEFFKKASRKGQKFGVSTHLPKTTASVASAISTDEMDLDETELTDELKHIKITYDFFMFLVRFHIPVPLVFILARPYVRLNTAPMIMGRSGFDTMTIAYRNETAEISRDVQTQRIYVGVGISASALLLDRQAVLGNPYASFSKYIGGAGVDFFDWYNPETLVDLESGTFNNSMFCIADHYNWRSQGTYIDLTGQLHRDLCDESSLLHAYHYTAAPVYARLGGFVHRSSSHQFTVDFWMDHDPRVATICVLATHMCWDDDKNCMVWVEGADWIGPGARARVFSMLAGFEDSVGRGVEGSVPGKHVFGWS